MLDCLQSCDIGTQIHISASKWKLIRLNSTSSNKGSRLICLHNQIEWRIWSHQGQGHFE